MKEMSEGKYQAFSDIIPYVHSLPGKVEISQHARLLTPQLIKQCNVTQEISKDAAHQLYLLFMRMYNLHPNSAKRLVLDGSVFVKNNYIRESFAELCPDDVEISLIHEEEAAERGSLFIGQKLRMSKESLLGLSILNFYK